MRLDISSNMRDVRRGLSDVARKQLPFATALALNEVGEEVRRATGPLMRARLDRPTPFTLKAFRVRRASKRRPAVEVRAQRIQAAYLALMEFGGTDDGPGGKPKPIRARVNKYGNLARGKAQKLLASPNVFSGRPKGGLPGGIYRRLGARAQAGKRAGHALKLEAAWVDRATYRPRLGFLRLAERRALRAMPGAFAKALRRALATAR